MRSKVISPNLHRKDPYISCILLLEELLVFIHSIWLCILSFVFEMENHGDSYAYPAHH